MEIKFTGQFGKLDRFADRVNKVPDALVTVNEQLAEETLELARECIARSRDPYGKKYAPLVLRDGIPLRDSGGLANSFFRRNVSRDGFAVANGKSYAIYPQKGTGIYGPNKKRIEPKKARWNERERRALALPGGIFRRSVKGQPKRRFFPEDGRLPKKWAEQYVDVATEVLEELFK